MSEKYTEEDVRTNVDLLICKRVGIRSLRIIPFIVVAALLLLNTFVQKTWSYFVGEINMDLQVTCIFAKLAYCSS